jgi:hypothetical protein
VGFAARWSAALAPVLVALCAAGPARADDPYHPVDPYYNDNEYIAFYKGNQSGRITFSQPVVNPVMAIQSLGNKSTFGRLFFGDEDFTVVTNYIQGGWGSSGYLKEGEGGSVYNEKNEGNGVVRFNGVFDHIDWTISDPEDYGVFTIGFDAVAPAGAAGLRSSNRVIGPSDYVDGFVNNKVEKFEYVPGSTETRANQKVGWALGYADASGWPTFYQKVNYGGESFQPKFPDLGWFGDYDFNNMADSLKFGSQTFKVIVYEHEKNTGKSLEIFGDVANFEAEHGDDWYDEIGSYKAYGYRYEDFKDHSYDWTSKPVDLFDTRIQLDYNLSTQARDVYDYRPVWKTSVQKVKVEKMQEVTVWEERPVYGTRTQIVTEVRYEDAFGGGSGGDKRSLTGGNIVIDAGQNVSISGKVAATGALSIDARQLLKLSGKATTAGAQTGQLATELKANAFDLESAGALRTDDSVTLLGTQATVGVVLQTAATMTLRAAASIVDPACSSSLIRSGSRE